MIKTYSDLLRAKILIKTNALNGLRSEQVHKSNKCKQMRTESSLSGQVSTMFCPFVPHPSYDFTSDDMVQLKTQFKIYCVVNHINWTK